MTTDNWLQQAKQDAATLQQVINDDTDVVARLGRIYPSLPKAMRLIVENGLLGATPFNTFADLQADTTLADDSYAVVSNSIDTQKNGIYQKQNGDWIYSTINQNIGKDIKNKLTALDILSQTCTTAYEIDAKEIEWGVVDTNNNIAIGLRKDGSTLLSHSTIESSDDYAFVVADKNGNVAIQVNNDGRVVINDASTSVCEIDKDIYLVKGNSATQITQTANNYNPVLLDDNTVSFLSNKNGRICQYVYDAKSQTVSPIYADNNYYEQIIITGQSLAQGGANSAITTIDADSEQAFMFKHGPVGSNNEQIKPWIKKCEESVNETIATSLAKNLSQQTSKKYLMTGQAYGGADYQKIKKNGEYQVYAKCIEQVKFAQFAQSSHVRAVILIHGEADSYKSNTNYDKDIKQLLVDYNADVKSVNSQTDDIVMLYCQTSSASGYRDIAARDSFTAPLLQLKAMHNNTDMYLVTPKYHFDYVDHAHIDAKSTRTLGEYYAKVYNIVINNGEKWQPLHPISIEHQNRQITIDFHVPKPPLVIDIETVLEGDDNTNKGFVLRNANDVKITAVEITSDTQVVISLDSDLPQGAKLSYALHNGTYRHSGRQKGARGNIRDSDNTTSIYDPSIKLHNWCVSFDHQF